MEVAALALEKAIEQAALEANWSAVCAVHRSCMLGPLCRSLPPERLWIKRLCRDSKLLRKQQQPKQANQPSRPGALLSGLKRRHPPVSFGISSHQMQAAEQSAQEGALQEALVTWLSRGSRTSNGPPQAMLRSRDPGESQRDIVETQAKVKLKSTTLGC